MAVSTHMEALLAELVGDVGNLHDTVQSLKDILPRQAEEFEAQITGLIGMLQKAGDVYESNVKLFTAKEMNDIRVRVVQEHNEATRTALGSVERAVKAVIEEPMKTVLRAQHQNQWRTMALCLASGLFGGVVVLAASYYGHDRLQDRYISYGMALTASWDKLDKKAQAIINAEREQ